MEISSIEPEPYAVFSNLFLIVLRQDTDINFFLIILLIILLLILSAIISGSEVAFFSLNKKNFIYLEKKKNLVDLSILRLLNKPKTLLATVLISNNLVNISIIILFTSFVNKYFDFHGNKVLTFLVEIIVITLSLVIFGELVPKIFANQNSLKFSRSMAFPMTFFVRLFTPLSYFMVKGSRIIEKRIRRKNLNISPEEIKLAIDITSKENQSSDDKKILKRIVNFGNVYVNQVMTSRLDVVAFDYTTPFTELLSEINHNRFSRVPVYQESPDNIIGILYIKDLLSHFNKNTDFDWQRLLKKPYFIPETKKIDDLLREFQSKKVHFAVVVDEYGGFSGIVTLEDILEEIVGEITDEFDETAESFFTKITENTFIFKGRTPLTELNKVLGFPDNKFDKYTGEVETLGGLMTELLGKIPVKGEQVSFENLSFVIESSDKKKVKEVRITLF